MTVQSDLQQLKERLDGLEAKVDSNRTSELREHDGINARINAVASELGGRMWQVGGAVVGSVAIAALAQGFLQ